MLGSDKSSLLVAAYLSLFSLLFTSLRRKVLMLRYITALLQCCDEFKLVNGLKCCESLVNNSQTFNWESKM